MVTSAVYSSGGQNRGAASSNLCRGCQAPSGAGQKRSCNLAPSRAGANAGAGAGSCMQLLMINTPEQMIRIIVVSEPYDPAPGSLWPFHAFW